MIRLHVTDDLAAGAQLSPAPEQAHYLLNVMRVKPGEALLLFNGRDGEWRATVAEADKRRCRLQLAERTREQAFPPDLELVVALVKRARLETIVEKAAELGCRRVRLIITRRTNAERTNVARLQAIATEASEQTGRLDVPEVVGPEKLETLLDGWEAGRRLMFCDEAGDDPEAQWGGTEGRARPVLEAILPRPRGRWPEGPEGASLAHGIAPPPSLRDTSPAEAGEDVGAILIGPEGGFDPAERARLRSLPFVTPVTLGPRILRADTAAISALTLWQAALGDWR